VCLIGWLLFTPVLMVRKWLFVRNARLELSENALTKTDWPGAGMSVARDEIGQVIRLTVKRSASGGGSAFSYWVYGWSVASYWVFASSSNVALVVVQRDVWPTDGLLALISSLGVSVGGSWDE